jgi:hypothetical protein
MVTRARRAAIEHLSDMRKKYGITTAQYVALYKDAVCAICGSQDSVVVGNTMARLVIDHDHSKEGVESIRGILCHQCNLMIGYAEDNPAILEAAIKYLHNYAKNGGPLSE